MKNLIENNFFAQWENMQKLPVERFKKWRKLKKILFANALSKNEIPRNESAPLCSSIRRADLSESIKFYDFFSLSFDVLKKILHENLFSSPLGAGREN